MQSSKRWLTHVFIFISLAALLFEHNGKRSCAVLKKFLPVADLCTMALHPMFRLLMPICRYIYMYAGMHKCTNTQTYICMVTQYLNNFPVIRTTQLHNTPKKSCRIKYMEYCKSLHFSTLKTDK